MNLKNLLSIDFGCSRDPNYPRPYRAGHAPPSVSARWRVREKNDDSLKVYRQRDVRTVEDGRAYCDAALEPLVLHLPDAPGRRKG